MDHLDNFLISAVAYLHSTKDFNSSQSSQLLRVTKILSVVDLRRCVLLDGKDHQFISTLSDLLNNHTLNGPSSPILWEVVKLLHHVCDQMPHLRQLAVVDYSCFASLIRLLSPSSFCISVETANGNSSAGDGSANKLPCDRLLLILNAIDLLISPPFDDSAQFRPAIDVRTLRSLTISLCQLMCGVETSATVGPTGPTVASSSEQPLVAALSAAVLSRLLTIEETALLVRSCVEDSSGLKKRLARSVANGACSMSSPLSQLCNAELLLRLTSVKDQHSVQHIPVRQLDQLLSVVVSSLCLSVTASDCRLVRQCGRVLRSPGLSNRLSMSTDRHQPLSSSLQRLFDCISSVDNSSKTLSAPALGAFCVSLSSLLVCGESAAVVDCGVHENTSLWLKIASALLDLRVGCDIDSLVGSCVLFSRSAHCGHFESNESSSVSARFLGNLQQMLESEQSSLLRVAHVVAVVKFLEICARVSPKSITNTWRTETVRPLFETLFVAANEQNSGLTVRLASVLRGLCVTCKNDSEWVTSLLLELAQNSDFLRLLGGALVSRCAASVEMSLQLLVHQASLSDKIQSLAAHVVTAVGFLSSRESVSSLSPGAQATDACSAAAMTISSARLLGDVDSALNRIACFAQQKAGGDNNRSSATLESADSVSLPDVATIYEFRLAAARRDVASLERALNSQQQLYCDTRRQLADAISSAGRCRQLLFVSEKRVQTLQQELTDTTSAVDSLRQKLDETIGRCRQLKEAAEQETCRSEKLADQLTHRNQQLVEAQQTLNARIADVGRLQAEADRLTEQLRKGTDESRQLQQSLTDCRVQLEDSKQQCDSLRHENNTLELLCKSHEQSIAEKEQRCVQLCEEVEQLRKIKDMIHSITRGAATTSAGSV